ncbi:hypothetical protein B0A50_07177 [Salinomyces thailandicus]|uniref:Conserved oligomeric Golgi complex subunit 4 n=1 Tax=Salinomyces thailandicus TaxID=706561 RepID=A0A4U0TMN6_9PEZI|nr:hypothetical protein B0A50_07177 [Salinomyces thailandica]
MASVHSAPPLPDKNTAIYTADSVSAIQSALAELGTREAAVTSRLDTLLSTQKDLSRHLNRLDLARAQLGSQVLATRSISHGMLAPASATASRISSAVRKLDREQANVRATLEVVEQVAELKACVLGVHGSMGAPQDWETAAGYLHRAFRIPDEVVDGAFAEETVPTADVPDAPRQTLEAAAESLCGLFLREFEKAARDGDGALVTRFFKLFPLIGRREVGLDAYGRYVCSGIAARARGNMSSAGQKREGVFYATALTKLFEHIAQIVDGHEGLVERHYRAGSMVKVIERIQVEADVQGGIILDTWAEERRVGRKLTEVKSYPFNFLVQGLLSAPRGGRGGTSRAGSPAPGSGRASEDDGVDMKEVDALLNEAAIMLGRWALYTRFLAAKTSPDTSEDDTSTTTLAVPPFITHSSLQNKVTDLLIDPFNTLATFFFRRSVEKAFQLDESPPALHLDPKRPLPANPPFLTSAVDDVMYITNQLLHRTLSTRQRSLLTNLLSALTRVLTTDFFTTIQRRMRDDAYPKPAIPGALPPESLIVSFMLLTNNLDTASDYLSRIVRDALNTDLDSTSFPFANDSTLVNQSIQSLHSSFAAKTTPLVHEALDVLLNTVLRPRLRPVLTDAFRNTDYTTATGSLSDSDSSNDDLDSHQASNDNDPVPARFARGYRAFTAPLLRLLTPHCATLLQARLLTHLARVLESRLWNLLTPSTSHGLVTPMAAIRLERDFGGVVTEACRDAPYEVRRVFGRVRAILAVVCEDEEGEAEDGEEEGGLGEGERKRVRAGLVGAGG